MEKQGQFLRVQVCDANVQFDDTLLLIEPEAARRYEANLSVSPKPGSVIVEGGTPQQTAVLGQSTLFQPPVGGWTPLQNWLRKTKVFLWLCRREPGDSEDASRPTGRRNYQQSRG